MGNPSEKIGIDYDSEPRKIEERKIIQETQKNLWDLSEKYEEIKTREDIQKFRSTFAWEKSRAEYIESLWANSKASLWSILKRQDLQTIYNELKLLMPEDEKLNPWNNWPITDKLKSLWYEFDNFFEAPEAMAVYKTIQDYVKNQSEVSGMNSDQKLALLLDFDKNWTLETKSNFNVWESQMDYIVRKWLTNEWIDVFMQNLGLTSMDDFSKKMSNNLYSSREEFQRILGSYIERWLKPAELTKKWWVKESLSKRYENQEKTSKEVSDTIDKSSVLQKKLDWKWISDEEMKSIKDTIKLEAVWVIVGSTNWLWASFDVKEFTNAYIDSIQVWIANGIPAVTFTKKLFEKYLQETGLTMYASLANIIIPILWASYKKWWLNVSWWVSPIWAAGWLSYTFEWNKDIKELFPENIKWTYEPSVYAWFSTAWHALWLSVAKVDMDRQKWIENAVDWMKDNLEVIKKDLIALKEFKNSEYNKKSENKENDEKIYNELKQVYEMFRGEKYDDKALNDMMSWYLNYYRNTLYKNASKWIKLDSIWWWVALVAWYLPIPYITLSWEKLKQEWKWVNHGNEREREITKKQISIKELKGSIIDNEKGNKVLSLPIQKNINYQLSDSTWRAQMERNEKTILLWWDISLSEVKISEYTTAESATYNIVVWEWVKGKNWVYKGTQENPIIKWLNISEEKSIKSSEVIVYDKEAFDNTQDIRNNINTIIQYDALDDKRTKWMMKLQKMIFGYKNNWKTTLVDAWEQMKEVVKHPGFMEYAKEKWAKNDAENLISKIQSITSPAEQDMILQSMVMSFMKKKWLEVKWTTAEIEGKKNNIAGYDGKRDKLFDSIYVGEWLENIKWNIISAKNEWIKANWEATNYTIKQQNDWIAFTWVASSGKDKIKQLMPYTWAYNIASVEGWKDFTPINWKSNELIDQIPNSTLNIIKEQLWLDGNFNNQQVRDFIKKWGDSSKGITVEYDLFFCKSWECLNDTIVLKNLRIKTPDWKEHLLWVDASWEVYAAENSVTKFWLAIVWEVNKKEEKPTESPTEKPTEHPTEHPTENPTEHPTEYPTSSTIIEEPTEVPSEVPSIAPTKSPEDF